MNVTQKLDKVTEQKIETINTEKDEMNAKFENHKMIIKSSISSDKKFLEEIIDTLTLSLEKANNEINQLKHANTSKSDKLKRHEDIQKELREKLTLLEENTDQQLVEQINNLRTELLNIVSNENNTATQPKAINNEQNVRNNQSANSDENTQNFEDGKQIKCDIVILMDSNRKFLQKNRLFPVKMCTSFPAQQFKRQMKYYVIQSFMDSIP